MVQVKAWLHEGKDVRLGDWKAADVEILNTFQLLTAKPVVYLVQVSFCLTAVYEPFLGTEVCFSESL